MLRGLGGVLLGLPLLAFGGIVGMAGLRDWRLWSKARRVVPVTPEQLADAARTRGLRRELVAIAGVAVPGQAGPLVSTVNGQACVWHRHTVHHRRTRRGTDGRIRTSLLRRRVADASSRESFALAGSAARIEVQPAGIHMDRPGRAGIRVLPALASQPFPDAAGLMGDDRYVHREWIIGVGTPVYVLAEASAAGKSVVVRRPAKGPHVISTRTAAGMRRHALAGAVAGFALAAACAIAGIIALIAR